jgi:hypothetical protein
MHNNKKQLFEFYKDFVPIGCVQPFAGTVAPEMWKMCDGSAVSRQ